MSDPLESLLVDASETPDAMVIRAIAAANGLNGTERNKLYHAITAAIRVAVAQATAAQHRADTERGTS